jgi:hypothetical protein
MKHNTIPVVDFEHADVWILVPLIRLTIRDSGNRGDQGELKQQQQ